jgi:hypothetical protein
MSPNRLVEIKEDSNLIYIVIFSSCRELTVQKPVAKQPGLLESKRVFLLNIDYLTLIDIKSKIMSTSYVRNYIFQQAQKKVMSQTQGLYPAPLKILDVCIVFY